MRLSAGNDEGLPDQVQADPWAAYLPGQELVPADLVSGSPLSTG